MVHIQLFLIHMALWNFVLFSVSRHHNQPYSSEQHRKPQSGSSSLSFFCSSFPSPRPSFISPVSVQVSLKLGERSRRRPLEFIWTASSSSMPLEKAENSQRPPESPEMSSDRWCQVIITLEGGSKEKAPHEVGECASSFAGSR